MDKEQYMKFSDAQIGSTINRPVLVSVIAENTARNGNTFVKVSLKDGFSEVTAMMFDASEESLASLGIRQNTIADAELSVSEYQGSKSFKIVQIRPTADSTLLVIEPAKGEYKDVFSKYGDILYGTNPRKTPLLRINPFSFPNDVHPSKKHIVQKGHLDNKYLSTSSCIYKNLST